MLVGGDLALIGVDLVLVGGLGALVSGELVLVGGELVLVEALLVYRRVDQAAQAGDVPALGLAGQRERPLGLAHRRPQCVGVGGGHRSGGIERALRAQDLAFALTGERPRLINLLGREQDARLGDVGLGLGETPLGLAYADLRVARVDLSENVSAPDPLARAHQHAVQAPARLEIEVDLARRLERTGARDRLLDDPALGGEHALLVPTPTAITARPASTPLSHGRGRREATVGAGAVIVDIRMRSLRFSGE